MRLIEYVKNKIKINKRNRIEQTFRTKNYKNKNNLAYNRFG